MTYKCIAIDDEPLALVLIKKYIERLPEIQLLQTFDDAISGGEFLRNNAVDILFVDVNMPDITGIELVRSLEVKPIIIFTTAYKKFAFEGFELEAIDYLLKPIDFDRFQKAVKKAIDFYQYTHATKVQEEESIFVRSEYRLVKINLADIEYIEGLEDYIKIHLLNARPVLTLSTLKSFIDKLPASKFQRIHRSYIVPLNKIASIGNRKVMLTSSKELPLSDTYTTSLSDRINKK